MGLKISDDAVGHAFWEWFPGVFAGLMPLLLFLASGVIAPHLAPDLPAQHPPLTRNDLEAHLLIFTIANSSVSVISSFARIKRIKGPIADASSAPFALICMSVVVLILASGAYWAVEQGTDGIPLTLSSFFLMAASIVPSFFAEIALARIAIANLPKPSKSRSGIAKSGNTAPQPA